MRIGSFRKSKENYNVLAKFQKRLKTTPDEARVRFLQAALFEECLSIHSLFLLLVCLLELLKIKFNPPFSLKVNLEIASSILGPNTVIKLDSAAR